MLGEFLKTIGLSFNIGIDRADQHILHSVQLRITYLSKQEQLSQYGLDDLTGGFIGAGCGESEQSKVIIVAQQETSALNAGFLV